MVTRQAFINKLRELGYKYKTRQRRTELYRRSGETPHFVSMPMSDLLDDVFVRSALRQSGCKPEEIERFIGEAKA